MKHENALMMPLAKAGVAPNIGGRWTNELKSWVDFTVDGAGKLIGHYHSEVGLNGSPEDSDDLSGYVHGDLVSFVVRWQDAAITAWVGHHRVDKNGNEFIETLWQLTLLSGDGQGGTWHSVLAGADTFHR